jgi:AcrR family transcriptional regulator
MTASSKATGRARAARLGPERRRPLVLDVAFELFLEHGYRGTSMDAVARAAGVSKPVIYDCFASKAELFGALLDREEQRMFAQFGAALASSSRSEDMRTMLTAGFVSMLRAVKDTPEIYRIALLGSGDVEAMIEARVRHGRNRQVAAISELARSWLAGRLPAERLDAVARFVGETLVAIGEAGVRTLLAAPKDWTPEALGALLAGLASGGFSTLLRSVPDAAESVPASGSAPAAGATPRRRRARAKKS